MARSVFRWSSERPLTSASQNHLAKSTKFPGFFPLGIPTFALLQIHHVHKKEVQKTIISILVKIQKHLPRICQKHLPNLLGFEDSTRLFCYGSSWDRFVGHRVDVAGLRGGELPGVHVLLRGVLLDLAGLQIRIGVEFLKLF